MAEFTVPKHGDLCWRELATKDADAAKKFYEGLFGWRLEQSKLTTVQYSEIHIADKASGGIIQMTEEWKEMPSHWRNYIAVDDCDATAEKIKEKGGSVCVPPFDAPNVGRISVVNDPGGATFSIIQFVSA